MDLQNKPRWEWLIILALNMQAGMGSQELWGELQLPLMNSSKQAADRKSLIEHSPRRNCFKQWTTCKWSPTASGDQIFWSRLHRSSA